MITSTLIGFGVFLVFLLGFFIGATFIGRKAENDLKSADLLNEESIRLNRESRIKYNHATLLLRQAKEIYDKET